MAEKQKTRLDSWKEIADYLGREVRTAIRWEQEKGLPVRRVPGGKGHSVFAYTHEIDKWLSGEKRDAGEDAKQPQREASKIAFVSLWSRTPPLVKSLLLATVSSLLLLAAVYFLGVMKPSGRVSRITFKDNKLTTLNEDNEVCWTYPFPANQDKFLAKPGAYISNSEGAGGFEVLACFAESYDVPRGLMEGGAELYSFSFEGKLLWRFVPHDRLLFAGREYSEPWAWTGWRVSQRTKETRIALTVHHFTFWPSILFTLDREGRVLGKFVNSGWIQSLLWLEELDRPILLAGGISNSKNQGVLAVLDGDQISGSSPEEPGSKFECTNCLPGRPMRYFSFPRSELNQATASRHNGVRFMEIVKDKIMVYTKEVDAELVGALGSIDRIYEFSRDLDLIRTDFDDQYWELHRRLELAGRIKHARDQCPDQKEASLVSSWDPQRGWTEIRPSKP